MSLPLAAQIAAMMEKLRPSDLAAMRPTDQRRFEDQCRHWADQVKTIQQPAPKASGVLGDLKNGVRSE